MTSSIRRDVLNTLDTLLTAWRTGDEETLAGVFAPNATFAGSAQGTHTGSQSIAAALASDFPETDPTRLVSTNEHVAGDATSTTLTAYLYGTIHSDGHLTEAVFGAVLLADLHRNGKQWVFTDLRVDLTFADGNTNHFASWQRPAREGWQVGDPTPVIVSEIDSPWSRNVPTLTDLSPEERVVDAYYRYAWAIDQGDITLLAGAYTSDAYGEFMPLGHHDNRRDIIGQQKAFRRHWPRMQHYGRALGVQLGDDRTTATMVIGRIIPQRDRTEDDQLLYGAHYQLELALDGSEWRIRHFDYREGWVLNS